MTHKIKTFVAYIEPWYKRQRKQFHLTHKEKYEEKFLAHLHLTRKCHAKQAALTNNRIKDKGYCLRPKRNCLKQASITGMTDFG
jgi:hypothetical protein